MTILWYHHHWSRHNNIIREEKDFAVDGKYWVSKTTSEKKKWGETRECFFGEPMITCSLKVGTNIHVGGT